MRMNVTRPGRAAKPKPSAPADPGKPQVDPLAEPEVIPSDGYKQPLNYVPDYRWEREEND